jgi:hypothetical protein
MTFFSPQANPIALSGAIPFFIDSELILGICVQWRKLLSDAGYKGITPKQ